MICVSELSFTALAAVLGMEDEKKSDAVLEEATRRLTITISGPSKDQLLAMVRFTGFADCPEPPEKPALNPMLPKAYYFGPYDQAGHHLHGPRGSMVLYATEKTLPWTVGELDGKMQPHSEDCGGKRSYCSCGSGPEGRALVHYKDGWTALSFWDRSVDPRGACNSTYIAQGEFSFNEMVAIAKAQFPKRWAKQKFEVVPA
jgi:hypothetical protein